MAVGLNHAAGLSDLLLELKSRHGSTQIFLFGPSGNPFWAARTPVRRAEIKVLTSALDFIEAMERIRPKPFLARHPTDPFSVAALGGFTDRYLVVLFEHSDETVGAEARVAVIRDEVDRWAADDPGRMELIRGAVSNPST